jgi:hypothetical protein
MFLSEYGCNSVPGARPFTEVPALYTKAMTSVFSGGLVYEYTQEQSNYGIVEIDKNGSITKLKDYTELKKQIGNISLPSDDGGYRTDLPQSSCPKFEKGVWEASDDLPSMPKDAETYIVRTPNSSYLIQPASTFQNSPANKKINRKTVPELRRVSRTRSRGGVLLPALLVRPAVPVHQPTSRKSQKTLVQILVQAYTFFLWLQL